MAVLHELEQEGKKQSLSNLIVLTEVRKTPLTSAIGKRKNLINTEHKGQVKNYKEIGFKGVMSTADVDEFTSNGRKTIKTYCQIFRDGTAVGKLADKVTEVDGLPKGEMTSQIADSLSALKLAKERRFLSNEDSSEDDNDKVPNETRGAVQWANPTAQGHAPVPDGYRPTSGQQFSGALAGLSETAFLDMLEAAFLNIGGSIDWDFYCGISLKRSFVDWQIYAADKTNFTSTRQYPTPDQQKVSRMVNFLETDMGNVRLVPCNNIMCDEETGAASAYTPFSGVGFDPRMMGEALNAPAKWNPLEDQGGGPRGYVDEISALVNDNPKAMISVISNSKT